MARSILRLNNILQQDPSSVLNQIVIVMQKLRVKVKAFPYLMKKKSSLTSNEIFLEYNQLKLVHYLSPENINPSVEKSLQPSG